MDNQKKKTCPCNFARLNTSYFAKHINVHCFHNTETSQLICRSYHLSGFYMIETLAIIGATYRHTVMKLNN